MTLRDLLGAGPDDVEIMGLAYDNRTVEPGTLFFCVPGFTRDDCLPMSVDKVEEPIRWKQAASLSQFKDRPICLRFHVQNVRLYAYRIA